MGFDREAADCKYGDFLAEKSAQVPVTETWLTQQTSQTTTGTAGPVMVAHVLREFLK